MKFSSARASTLFVLASFSVLLYVTLSGVLSNENTPSSYSSASISSSSSPPSYSYYSAFSHLRVNLFGILSEHSDNVPKNRALQKSDAEEEVMGVDENGQPVKMRTIASGNSINAAVNMNRNNNANSVVDTNINTNIKMNMNMIMNGTVTGDSQINQNSQNNPSNPSSDKEDVEGKLFFMYDLDEEFWWRWPDPNADCSQNGYMTHTHAELSGIGPPILPDEGLFLTWHFSLFSSLFNRMKRSKRRTYDPEKASLFIIPYDLGLDGYLDAKTCRNTRRCTKGHPEKVQQHVMSMPYFARNGGKDHAVLWSLGQYHPWPSNGCDLFMRNFCALCTFTCYWMDPTKENSRFVSIPFPSGYHWWEGIKNIPWEVPRGIDLGSDSGIQGVAGVAGLSNIPYVPRNLTVSDSITNTYEKKYERNLTAVYLGSTQTLNPAHTKIRRAMTAQCNASTECHWKQIAHSSTDNNIADLLSIYRRSIFCLCPPGDDPARKAVFDSILSGCIPVIFEVATLYNQYPWHLGEEASLDISVSIPGGAIRSGKMNLMTVLQAIPIETIKLKQLAIAKYAPNIQYAIPPLELLRNRSDLTPWEPPFKDGVDCTLDGLFIRTARAVRNQSTGIPHRLMTSREWSKEYDVVKIKIPGVPLGGGLGSIVVNPPVFGMEGQGTKHLKSKGKDSRSFNSFNSSSSSSSSKGAGHKKSQKRKNALTDLTDTRGEVENQLL